MARFALWVLKSTLGGLAFLLIGVALANYQVILHHDGQVEFARKPAWTLADTFRLVGEGAAAPAAEPAAPGAGAPRVVVAAAPAGEGRDAVLAQAGAVVPAAPAALAVPAVPDAASPALADSALDADARAMGGERAVEPARERAGAAGAKMARSGSSAGAGTAGTAMASAAARTSPALAPPAWRGMAARTSPALAPPAWRGVVTRTSPALAPPAGRGVATRTSPTLAPPAGRGVAVAARPRVTSPAERPSMARTPAPTAEPQRVADAGADEPADDAIRAVLSTARPHPAGDGADLMECRRVRSTLARALARFQHARPRERVEELRMFDLIEAGALDQLVSCPSMGGLTIRRGEVRCTVHGR